jgi:hypothetical protein
LFISRFVAFNPSEMLNKSFAHMVSGREMLNLAFSDMTYFDEILNNAFADMACAEVKIIQFFRK